MTIPLITWSEIKDSLRAEFTATIGEFKHWSSKGLLDADTIIDFNGLVEYILRKRPSFQDNSDSKHEGTLSSCNAVEILTALETGATNTVGISIVSGFEKLFYFEGSLDPEMVGRVLFKYWKQRNPSLKESYLIPLACKYKNQLSCDHEVFLKIRNRLQKGKFVPFEESFELANFLNLNPQEVEIVDIHLANLKCILAQVSFAEQRLSELETYHGCHCD